MSETFLSKVVAKTHERVALTKRAIIDPASLRRRARRTRDAKEPHGFRAALARTDRTNIIAEIKRASPSKGAIKTDVDVAEIALAYQAGGGAAISVLTEPHFFGGSLDDLVDVGQTVALPVLRKDFIVDEHQIYEAAALGADAVLLIVAALPKDDLTDFLLLIGEELGMDALVEVHTVDELRIANDLGAEIIGVNNRDLQSLEVSLDVSRNLILERPAGALMIAESGISTRGEIDELETLGFNGFLIGETLMRSGDIVQELRRLTARNAMGMPATERNSTRIKICGITNLDDALLAATLGVDELGFNFYEKSPRYIAPELAAAIISELPPNIKKVGVFVNESVERICEIVETAGLDAIQLHGDESVDHVADVGRRSAMPVIKAIRITADYDVEDVMQYDARADAILLDSYSPKERGGTGEVFDWEVAAKVAESISKLYLAGGLSQENIAHAIITVRPFAVDACSRLESSPGKKDKEKVAAFIKAAKEAL